VRAHTHNYHEPNGSVSDGRTIPYDDEVVVVVGKNILKPFFTTVPNLFCC